MAELGYFTVISHRLGAVGVDYVDTGTEPDETPVYAFVDFIPREPAGTVHWLSGLTNPRGIKLETIRGRYSPEDGKLRTIIAGPVNEQQLVTVTGTPFTLTYSGSTTSGIASGADPGAVQAALEALSSIGEGNVYVYRVVTNEKQQIAFSGAPTGGVFTLSAGTTSTSGISRNANHGTVQEAIQSLPEIGDDNCSVTGPVGGPWPVEFTGTLAGTDIPLLTASSAGLTPTGTVVITTTVPGSSTAPYRVNFIGALAGTDVPVMTATNATIATGTPGAANEGVMLVANTAVLDLDELIYDVQFTIPRLDRTQPERVVAPFAIAAPTTAGTIVDLADDTLHLPPKPA